MTQPREHRQPYRIVVFASDLIAGKRRKRFTELVQRDYAYVLWNPVQHYQEARLPNAGSFVWPGIVEACKAAMHAMSDPSVREVSVRTNQDRRIYRYYRRADGSITGYGCMGDC